MRLELNLPALERLIGGDTEIEIGIREQIANEFAQRHLKALLNDSTFQKVHTEWRKEVDGILADKYQELLNKKLATGDALGHATYGGWLLSRIYEAVEKAVSEEIEKYTRNTVEKWSYYIRTDLQRIVDGALKRKVNEMVEEEIQRRLTLLKEMK